MPQFTKKAIIESFVRLLNIHTLDDITVKDIVEDCGVNRKTFYYYFEDIYALLRELLEEETGKILCVDRDFESWEESLAELMIFALNNKKAIYHIYNSEKRDQLDGYLFSAADKIMTEFISKHAEGLSCSPDDVELLAKFYTNALLGSIFGWIRDGMKDDPHLLCARLSHLLRGSVELALKNAAGQV